MAKRKALKTARVRATLDRLEDGRWAVFTVRGGGQMAVPAKLFSGGVHEGQAFDVDFRPNAAEEKRLRNDVARLQQELLKKNR